MAWVEVYGGQRSLAFELTTAILWLEIHNKRALGAMENYGRLCQQSGYVRQSYYNFYLLELTRISLIFFLEVMVAKCFYLSRNLFQSLSYGKLKCVFAVIWLYTWYMKVKIWGISGIVWVNIRHLYEAVLKHFRDIGFILWDFVSSMLNISRSMR